MKKYLSILLVLALLLTVTGCGALAEKAVAAVKDQDEPETIVPEDPEEEPEEEPAKDVDPEAMWGVVDGITYSNPWFDFGLILDSDWTFATEEEIAANQSMVGDLMGEDFEEAMEDGMVMVMMASNYTTGQSVNMSIQKADPMVELVGLESTMEASLPEVERQMENAGMTGVTVELEDGEFLGESAPLIAMSYELQGVTFYTKGAMVLEDGYMATITAGGISEDDAEAIMGYYCTADAAADAAQVELTMPEFEDPQVPSLVPSDEALFDHEEMSYCCTHQEFAAAVNSMLAGEYELVFDGYSDGDADYFLYDAAGNNLNVLVFMPLSGNTDEIYEVVLAAEEDSDYITEMEELAYICMMVTDTSLTYADAVDLMTNAEPIVDEDGNSYLEELLNGVMYSAYYTDGYYFFDIY